MNPTLSLSALALATLLSLSPPTPTSSAPTLPLDHSALDAFLKAHVKPNGLVDYLAVRRPENMAPLNAYLDAMSKVDDLSLPHDERLALYCNLYNAVMIKIVAERYRVGFMPSENNFRIFKEPTVRLGVRDGNVGNELGRTISLDDLEHDLIRKRTPDPRIHAAVVCAALDCPELIPEAYTSAQLNAQLQDRMTRWLTSPIHTPINPTTKTIHPSGLFLTYAADFGGKDALDPYIRKFLPPPHNSPETTTYQIVFRSAYNWTPNLAPPAQPHIYITTPSANLTDKPDSDPTAKLITRAGLGTVHKVLSETPTHLQIEHPRLTTPPQPPLWLPKSATSPLPPLPPPFAQP